MKKISKIFLSLCLIGLVAFNLTFIYGQLQDSRVSINLLQIAAADPGESGGEDYQETFYDGTECCTLDNGCEECTTTVCVRCWLPGPGPCEPDWFQIVDIIC